jgi:hypothetical protein
VLPSTARHLAVIGRHGVKCIMPLRSWFSAFPSEKQASAKIYLAFRQLGSLCWPWCQKGEEFDATRWEAEMDRSSTSKWIAENWSCQGSIVVSLVHGFFSSVVMIFQLGESSACLHEFRYAAWGLNEVVRRQATAWRTKESTSARKDCKVGGCGNAYNDVTLGSEWSCDDVYLFLIEVEGNYLFGDGIFRLFPVLWRSCSCSVAWAMWQCQCSKEVRSESTYFGFIGKWTHCHL